VKVPPSVVEGFLRAAVRPVLGPPFPVAVQRWWQDALSATSRPPRGVGVTPVVLGDRPALRFDPAAAAGDRAVLWLHGGAFITGSFATHGAFAGDLAAAAGVRVYLLDYRLAPEHPHPAAVDDAVAALRYVPEGRVLLGGDSAGGCLALLTALRTPRELAGLALISPVVDATQGRSLGYDGKDVLVRPGWVEQGVSSYFGDEPPNLLDVDLTSLPPTVVHVSEHERLRAEGEDLAHKIGAELLVIDDAWHDVHLQGTLVRIGQDAVARLGASVSALLTAGG
jgi:acetyl esterase/lipase